MLHIYDISIIEGLPYSLYNEWGKYINMKADMQNDDKPDNLLNKGTQGLIQGLTG